MLDNANNKTEFAGLLPVIALCGLAGIRLQEVARLTWEDVFRVKGHVEISTAKSKTRSRRLVTVCPALARWLNPYRDRSALFGRTPWTAGTTSSTPCSTP